METLITILSGNDKERFMLFNIWYKYYFEHLKIKNIIVVSQNEYPNLSKFKLTKHVKIKTKNKLFNRSMCINRGVLASKTERCIVLDSDILIPKENINFFSESLASNNFCIPYNYCMNLSKEETKKVNFDKLSGGTIRRYKNASKGGVLFCNKSRFITLKGYDENFWGWGGEDDAFFEKIKKLDKVYRPDNDYKIYHLYHERVGGGKNPNYSSNVKLYKKYVNMSKEELLKYLDIKK